MTSSSPRQLEPGTIVSEHFEPFEVNCILIGDPASVQSLFDALAEIGVPRPTPSTSDVGCSCCTVNLPDHDPKGMWSTSSGPGVTLRLQTRAAGSSYGKECAVLPPARPEDAPNKRGARSVVVVAMVRSPDIRLPDDVAEDLRTVYGAGFSDNRNLLLVDCGICYGRKMKSAALGMALEVYAYKLMQWSTEHNLASLELLISLILETARVPGYVPRIDYNGMAPEFGTALDITEMTPSAVQGVLQYLSTDTSGAGSIANVALRRWVQVKNWPAVTELILAQAVGDKTVNLSQLSLEAVPEQLTGITCRKLDLRGNSITHLPQWLLHADVDTILLGYECIPPPLRGKSWNVVKHCMLFGEEPTFPNSHKLIIIGDNTILQAEFLKCLMDNRHKFKMKNTLKSCAPPVISTHLPFKTSKKIIADMDCMELEWTCASVLFMLLSQQIHRLHFWLQEIAQGHMQANVCGRAQIIIVAYSPFKDFDLHKPVNELLEPILQSPIWKTNLTLRGVYSLNYSMTSASFSETAPFICQRGVSVGTPAASICELLETIVSTASSTPVSPRWINLAHRLSKVRECVIKWTVFVQMALFFGVGAPLGGGRNPEVDIQMCCDFLSDTGAIIHFRHPCWSKSQRDLSQFVVLKLEWFNQIINDLADSIQSTRSSNSSILAVNDKEESPSNERATESTHFFQHLRELPSYSPLLLSLLRELNIVFLCENVPYLSYSLPTGASDSGLNFINAFWGGIYAIKPSKRSQVIFNGRSIDIGCTHDELSRKIMNILRQVPRLTQQFVGDSRIWVSKKSEGISQDVLVAFPDKLPIDIFMRTTLEIAENGDTPIGHAQNLGAYIIMWIRQFCETNNLPVHELFPCPHCLKLQIEHSTMPNIHYFKSSDVFDTTLSGNTSLKCPNQEAIDAPVNLTHVAPELSFLKIDKIGTSELPCDTPPGMVITKENENSASECYQLIEAGRRVSTTAERVMPLISVLREIPKHSRVVNYIGARYSNGRYFMTVTEPFPPTIPPRFTEEILGIQRKGSPLNLRDLIKFCMDRPKAIGLKPNLTSFIDQVLPMSLRAKILRDVAKGLALLHSQHPPLIHGGFLLEAGTILVSSLLESAPGPWAKVAYLGQVEEETVLTLQALPNDNYQNNRIPGRGDSKTDVWNFGVLVHQLVSPFNPLVEVQITTGRSAGPFHPSSLLPKTARNSNNFPPPSPTKTNSTLIVDIHRLHSAVMAIAESATAAAVAFTTTFESPEVPLWAKQVMECCWTVDPASRPSMACLLNIWCHFDSEK